MSKAQTMRPPNGYRLVRRGLIRSGDLGFSEGRWHRVHPDRFHYSCAGVYFPVARATKPRKGRGRSR